MTSEEGGCVGMNWRKGNENVSTVPNFLLCLFPVGPAVENAKGKWRWTDFEFWERDWSTQVSSGT